MNVLIAGVDLSNSRKVLLLSPPQMEEEDLFQLKQVLETEFPETDFLILSGGFQIVSVVPNTSHYSIES